MDSYGIGSWQDDTQDSTDDATQQSPIDAERLETVVAKMAHSRRAAGFSDDEIRELAERDLGPMEHIPDDEYGSLQARGLAIVERVIFEPDPGYSPLFIAASRVAHKRNAGQALEALVAARLRGEPIE